MDETCSSSRRHLPRDDGPSKTTKKPRTRTRTGCLNCRRKKRKCDEKHPTCGPCERQGVRCPWGLRISFRQENALTIEGGQRSSPGSRAVAGPRGFEILDMTADVVREQRRRSSVNDNGAETNISPTSQPQANEPSPPTKVVHTRSPISIPFPGAFTTSERYTSALRTSLNRVQEPDVPRYDQPEPLLPPMPIDAHAHLMRSAQDTTPEGTLEDVGVFLPGSTYHELHSTLRSHLIREVRSDASTTVPLTRTTSSGISKSCVPYDVTAGVKLTEQPFLPLPLGAEEEVILWRNWFDEIAPWLDKFDIDCHFQHTIPTMASSATHLNRAILALSARQLELKQTTKPTGRSLSLYQEAIHLLLPHLRTRSTAVIASCVILCVLEMLSCSPKAWKRHLDGCASMMQAVGIDGFVGGVEQALFWCFARMDVCGGLISSVKTLIPVTRWASSRRPMAASDLDADVALFRSSQRFDNWANYAVYLVAQVLDLVNPGTTSLDIRTQDINTEFSTRWAGLWQHITDWYTSRPAPLHAVATAPSSQTSPFPTVLFANAAAISGTQLYHTASIIMLQNRPTEITLSPEQKLRGVLWHARQICAISISNHHHGAWTNSIQPLWIAGQCMSHPDEHRAILEILDKIEKASGWGTRWRANDLREFWGDLGE